MNEAFASAALAWADPSSSATILVVEDEAIVLLGLRRMLQRFGYVVCGTAASADEAVQAADALRPDLVLMDIRLHGPRDGISAAHEIRERMDVPVIYVTAHADPATRARALATRPSGFVSKPFAPEALRRAIEQALAGKNN
jgi:two-component system, response regulator PdtaR